MSLNSFREVLLKKCEDESLQNLIKYAKEELLTKLVFDSLKKMGHGNYETTARQGLNPSLLKLSDEIRNDEDGVYPDMFHDAISHHASHYKAALSEGNQAVANQHARKLFDLVLVARKLKDSTNSKLQIHAVHPKAWVSNSHKTVTPEWLDAKNKQRAAQGKGPIDKEVGDHISLPKNWNHRGSDFTFLQQPPDPHKTNIPGLKSHSHREAYPMEEIMVNGKYLTIDDSISGQDANRFTPHELDSHPGITIGKRMARARPEEHERYFNDHPKWMENEYSKWADRHEKMYDADPKAYESRGSKKPDSIHAPVDNPLVLGEQHEYSKPQSSSAAAPTNSNEVFENKLKGSDLPDHIKQSIFESSSSATPAAAAPTNSNEVFENKLKNSDLPDHIMKDLMDTIKG